MTELSSTEEIVKIVMGNYDLGFDEFDQSKGITVEALCFYCMQEIIKGNAQRHIQISMDDEGNAFHTLFYGLTTEGMDLYDHHDKVNYKEIIHLG